MAVIVFAGSMMISVVGKDGKQTISSAVLVVTGMIGYLVVLSSQVITGGPMYGWVVVIGGAVLGFLGGMLANLSVQ